MEEFDTKFSERFPKPDKPKNDPLAVGLRACKTLAERKTYVRLATDNLVKSHIATKGFDSDLDCRVCLRGPETLGHFIGSHIPFNPTLQIPLAPAFKRKLSNLTKNETIQLAIPNKRIRLFPSAEIIGFLSQCFQCPEFQSVRYTPRFRKKCYASKRPKSRRQGKKKNIGESASSNSSL